MKTSGGDRVGTALKAVLPILPCSDLIIRDGHAYIHFSHRQITWPKITKYSCNVILSCLVLYQNTNLVFWFKIFNFSNAIYRPIFDWYNLSECSNSVNETQRIKMCAMSQTENSVLGQISVMGVGFNFCTVFSIGIASLYYYLVPDFIPKDWNFNKTKIAQKYLNYSNLCWSNFDIANWSYPLTNPCLWWEIVLTWTSVSSVATSITFLFSVEFEETQK